MTECVRSSFFLCGERGGGGGSSSSSVLSRESGGERRRRLAGGGRGMSDESSSSDFDSCRRQRADTLSNGCGEENARRNESRSNDWDDGIIDLLEALGSADTPFLE